MDRSQEVPDPRGKTERASAVSEVAELRGERLPGPCLGLGASPRAPAASTCEVALRQVSLISQLEKQRLT